MRNRCAALLALTASAASAQVIEQQGASTMVCDYTSECFEEEPCTFAQFGHDLEIPRTMPGEAVLHLGTGDAPGAAQIVNDVLVVSASDANASYMMSNADNGYAKLSVHFAKDLSVVTYHGTCKITAE
ncbi:hypothetical protein [Ponticoccus sp. (in: a-proteobacteria)]|uniref:hypothetical protein n=1 Tax=Ponticoccus sp. (in: a-proteobacteria) TaxID=1925025 RepID=UPI003AB632C8